VGKREVQEDRNLIKKRAFIYTVQKQGLLRHNILINLQARLFLLIICYDTLKKYGRCIVQAGLL
jgi:hypothetical protein